jgi:NAD(P)-dependent dehydrogenase (short-subunit alcohol dehydrogenase family)
MGVATQEELHMKDLHGQVAIVTGGGRGAGRAIARALAAQGMRVLVGARTQSDVERVAEGIREQGGEAEAVAMDVRDPSGAQALADRALDRWGRIDVLVNNAGVGGNGAVAELPLETWRRCLDTNLTGTFLCSQAVLPAMLEQGSGCIIMISSGAGKQGYANMAAYCASKFGVMGFAQSLAAEVGDDGIKVCAITPGSMLTDFGGSGRSPRPGAKYLTGEDLAEAIVYLLEQSERAWTQEMSLWPFKVLQPADKGAGA